MVELAVIMQKKLTYSRVLEVYILFKKIILMFLCFMFYSVM